MNFRHGKHCERDPAPDPDIKKILVNLAATREDVADGRADNANGVKAVLAAVGKIGAGDSGGIKDALAKIQQGIDDLKAQLNRIEEEITSSDAVRLIVEVRAPTEQP